MKIVLIVSLFLILSCCTINQQEDNPIFELKSIKDKPTGIDVEIDENMENEIELRLIYNKDIISKNANDKLIVKIDSPESPFDNIFWFCDGVKLLDLTKVQIKIYSIDLFIGFHTVSVIVKKGNRLSSATFIFKVID